MPTLSFLFCFLLLFFWRICLTNIDIKHLKQEIFSLELIARDLFLEIYELRSEKVCLKKRGVGIIFKLFFVFIINVK